MIYINNVRFSIGDERDLHKSFVVFKLTLSSSGKSVILASRKTLLGRVKRWLGEQSSLNRFKYGHELSKDLETSEVIYIDLLWSGNGDMVKGDERLVELYNVLYDKVGEQRTYKPYGYNDLRIDHHEGGIPATAAVMRLRVKEGLHRTKTEKGDYIYVKCDKPQKRKPKNNFKILQFDLEYNFIREWDTMAAICKEYKIKLSTLRAKSSQCILKSTGEIDNVCAGYRWFSEYRADWYEREQELGGGWKYSGKYDLSKYHDGYSRTYKSRSGNGVRRSGHEFTRRHNPMVIREENTEALMIMGGLTNE